MPPIELKFDAYSLPLAKPWLSNKDRLDFRSGWLITATDATGNLGYGDCSPLPASGTENHAQAERLLHLLAQQKSTAGELLQLLSEQHPDHPAVRCGISTALLDIQARQRQLSLGHLLNQQASAQITVNAAAGTLMHINPENLQQLQQQFRTIKLKVGIATPTEELARLQTLASTLQASTQLRLDANQAWNQQQAAFFLAGLQGLPIESIEEPLRQPTLTALEKLQSSTHIPLAADESLAHLGASTLIRNPVVRRLVLKPMVLGGLQPSLDIARQAHAASMQCVVTSLLESAAGIWPSCQLAAAIEPLFPGLDHGLDTSHWLSQNTGEPPTITAGRIQLPHTAGSGFSPYAR